MQGMVSYWFPKASCWGFGQKMSNSIAAFQAVICLDCTNTNILATRHLNRNLINAKIEIYFHLDLTKAKWIKKQSSSVWVKISTTFKH